MSKLCSSIMKSLAALIFLWSSTASSLADPVADFYRGKTVRVIVGFGSGGAYDFYGRLVAAQLGKFVPGNPSVIVENMPGASSLKAAEYVYNRTDKDGTVIGLFLNNFALAKLLTPSLRIRA